MTINVLDPKEFPSILRLLKSTGGKYIIVEDGKPSFALMSISEYEKLLNDKEKTEKNSSSKALIDKINSDIANWKLENEEEDNDEEEDYSEYIPKKNWVEDKQCIDYEALKENSQKNDLVNEDLSYYYDVDEEQEDERFDF
ncbi:MAG: hypothetical protein WC663_04535 [Patescibacteria group bacterium]|jgi:hypothetical protein